MSNSAPSHADENRADRGLNGSKYFPRRLSFPKLCDILVAYLNAGADKEYVGVSDVADRSNVSLHNISRNNNFLKSWRFAEESEQEPGKYVLSREGAEFAYAYRIDPNGERTREMLKRVLSEDEVLKGFIERIGSEGLTREAVLVELPRVIGDLRADKVGVSAFVDMIAYAFNIEDLPSTAPAPRPATGPRRLARPTRKAVSPTARFEVPTASISINLNISPDVSPGKLKEYMKAIMEALQSTEEEEE